MANPILPLAPIGVGHWKTLGSDNLSQYAFPVRCPTHATHAIKPLARQLLADFHLISGAAARAGHADDRAANGSRFNPHFLDF
jgi:hypothetical protein